MTVEAFTEQSPYTVSGTGPYAIGHAYLSDAIVAMVILSDGAMVALSPGSDYTVTPDAGDAGDLTLSARVASTYAGMRLVIDRATPVEQGFAGQTARESGLEENIDRQAMALQEVIKTASRSLRTTRDTLMPYAPTDGRGPIWDESQGRFVNGPTAANIADAQGYAERAEAAAIAAAEYGPSRAPFLLLAMGQSNAKSSPSSTGGDQEPIDGVYFWDNDASAGNTSAGFVEGTRYQLAEFGEPPLNITNDGVNYANSVAFQAAKQIRLDTGRPVYVIQLALGGINLESFLDPATVAANGWETPDQNMFQFMYPGIRTAIDAVPGRAGTELDAFFWIHGGANASDMVEVHAAKLNQLCLELRDGGLIDLQEAPVVTGEITPYGDRAFRKRQVNAYRSAQFFLPTLRVARMMNAYTTDRLHFTGRFMKEAARRFVNAMHTQPDLHDADEEALGLDVDDGLLSFTYHNTATQNMREAPWRPIQSVSDEIGVENHADLGWCYTRQSGSGTIVTRKVFPVPKSGCAVFEFEATSPGTAGVAARVYQYDINGNFIEFNGQWPGGGGQIDYNGTAQTHVQRVYPNGQGEDFEFHPDAVYFCFGIRYTAASGAPVSFRLHRLGVDAGGVPSVGANVPATNVTMADGDSVQTKFNRMYFALRPDFRAAQLAGGRWDEGRVVCAGRMWYRRSIGADMIPDMLGWEPLGDVYADHFADEDTTDWAPAIVTAAEIYGPTPGQYESPSHTVHFLAHDYPNTGFVILPDAVDLLGANRQGTRLLYMNTTGNHVQFGDLSNLYHRGGLSRMTLAMAEDPMSPTGHVEMTSGYHLVLNRMRVGSFHDFDIEKWHGGIQLVGSDRINIYDAWLMNRVGDRIGKAGRAISQEFWWDGTMTGSVKNGEKGTGNKFNMVDAISGGNGMAETFFWLDTCDGGNIDNCHGNNFDVGLRVVTADDQPPIGGLMVTGTYLDEAEIHNMLIEGDGTFQNAKFTSTYLRKAGQSSFKVEPGVTVNGFVMAGSSCETAEEMAIEWLAADSTGIVIGKHLFDDNLRDGTTASEVYFNGANLTLTGSGFQGGHAGATTVSLGPASSGCLVDGNNYAASDNGTMLSDAGTGNRYSLGPQDEADDTTAGRLLKVGGFGVGGEAVTNNNFDTISASGFYRNSSAAATGAPSANANWRLIHWQITASAATQMACRNGVMRQRDKTAGSWGAWSEPNQAAFVADASAGSAAEINALRDAIISAGLMAPS